MSEMLIAGLGELLPVIVSAVLVPMVVLLGKKLNKWLDSKIDNEHVSGLVQKIMGAIMNVVKELSQSMAEKFKEASEDGKLSDAEKKLLADFAVEKIKSMFGLGAIMKAFGLLSEDAAESFVRSSVEAAVHDMSVDRVARGLSMSAAQKVRREAQMMVAEMQEKLNAKK